MNSEQTLTAREPGQYRSTLFSRRMKRLFRLAGLAPMSPHKFRHGHASYALKRSRTISDFKAVSMHLGHASLAVTDQEYGILSDDDVHAKISRFSENGVGDVDEERLLEVLREVLRRVG